MKLLIPLVLCSLIHAAPQSIDGSSADSLSNLFAPPSDSTTYPVIITLHEDAPKDDVANRILEMMDTSNADNEYKADLDTVLNGIAGSFSSDILHTIEQEFPDSVKVIEPDQMMKLKQSGSTILKQAPLGNWGQGRISQSRLNTTLPYMYPASGGAGVDVYVLDSGIYPQHPDFDPNFVTMDKVYVPREPPVDFAGHGTFVTSQIAGKLFGVAKKARVHMLKVLNRFGGGLTSDILLALEYATREHMAKSGARSIISMSIGGPVTIAVNSAVNAAFAAGILVIAAAGNEARDACMISPASAPGAFVVGATDQTDVMAPYSNYGPCVNMFAPGHYVRGGWIPVVPPGSVAPPGWLDFPAVYLSGTSMAVPYVTGVAALIMSTMPYHDVRYVRSQLSAMSQKFAISGIPPRTGTPNRLVNIRAMLTIYWYVKMQWLARVGRRPRKITSWDELIAAAADISPLKRGALQYAPTPMPTPSAQSMSYEDDDADADQAAFLQSSEANSPPAVTVSAPPELNNPIYAMDWQQFTVNEQSGTNAGIAVDPNNPLFTASAVSGPALRR